MKKTNNILFACLLMMLFLPIIFVSSTKADLPPEVEFADYINSDMQTFIAVRDRLITEGDTDSEEFKTLQSKIDLMFQSIRDNKDTIDRCMAEATLRDAEIQAGTFDEVGFPDFPEVTQIPNPIRILYGKDCGDEPFFPAIYHDLNFDSSADSSYEHVITGSYKETGKAFLTIIDSDTKNYYDQIQYDYVYDNIGQILITDVLDDEKIMLFTYDGANKGYVDLASFEVFFTEYKGT